MNPSIKRLLGALLLIGTLGVSSVMAVRANAQEVPSVIESVLPAGAGLHG